MTTEKARSLSSGLDEHVPSSFFVVRTPLLPFEVLAAWSETGGDGERPAAARARLRAGLRELAERPEIREALFVASPDLEVGLEAWRRQPDGKKGRRAERALVRYLYRMTMRPTPFGLFSGCSVGRIGRRTRLRLKGRRAYRRHSRLDTDYMFALNEALSLDPELRRKLRYRPNSSLYQAAGRVRYVEARLEGTLRRHHLVAVEASEYLDEVLRMAASGARVDELAAAIVAVDPDAEIAFEEAAAFVDELIDNQILVSSLSPPMTGQEAMADLLAQLRELSVAGPVIERLEAARAGLAALDAAGLGNELATYREVASCLEPLPAGVHPARLFQVDMTKPAPVATLGSEVLAEIARGIEVLRRVTSAGEDPLERFRRDFVARYQGRSVPLVEALDEEVGVGFGTPQGPGAAASPLLGGFVFPFPAGAGRSPWGGREDLLLSKLTAAYAEDLLEVELTDEDLGTLAESRLAELPGAFQAMATVAAASQEALEQGDFLIHIKNIAGPSGVRLMGRFCHSDRDLRRRVEQHLRQEEALDPEAVFAEIVHLPEGRLGNVIARPVLRRWEIPLLGRGGASPEYQIPVTDLELSVERDKLILRSMSSGRRVIPRMTNAHTFSGRCLSLYRFLCTLQSQGVCEAFYWSWGPLDKVAFLPRVRCGRLVLARARWRVSGEEIRELAESRGGGLLAAVDRWRSRRRIPRWAVLLEGDQELPVDFHNLLSVETLLSLIERRSQVLLDELFPGPDQLCVSGPEGRFLNEIVVPFLSRHEAVPETGGKVMTEPARRRFASGSQWLYAKLYTGTMTADEVLVGAVGPLVREMVAGGAIDRWFFLRYGDPEWHLRLRLHGEPERLHGEVLPRLQATLAPLLDSGRVWRWQLDTYERELERYGGGQGIELAERLFSVDSDACLAILEGAEGDEGAADRWRLCLRGIDLLLSDLGLGLEAKSRLLKSLRESFGEEFGIGTPFKKQLARRLRRERRAIDEALEPTYDAGHPLAYGFDALDRRSRRLAPIVAELGHLARQGRLGVSLDSLAASFVHMFANRLLRSDGRAHELVLYDFLYQTTLSRAARVRAARVRAPRVRAGRPVAAMARQ